MTNQVLIIAEAGVNHNGSLRMAKKLVDVAADSGADFVKFQTFKAERLISKDSPKADYQIQSSTGQESQFQMLKRLELSHQDHVDLINHCLKKGIGFLSTGFDIESVDLLRNLGQKLFKIPSGEITNRPLLHHLGSLGFPVILSTGMSTMNEVSDALSILESTGLSRSKITVLHCTSAYPTPISDVNLRAMCSIQQTFDVAVGYSDHTVGIEVPLAAVALGALVIEKHFTVNRLLPGPDHKASIEPHELASMVRGIRNVEIALGSQIKSPVESERSNLRFARKSIYAGTEIRAGETFTSSNLVIRRPADGRSPMDWDQLIGTRAERNYLPGEVID